ncbi:MAG: hypothetical protein LUO98_01935 [Methanoregula sp.]|nr:hypothetical protein [Methanoregula sp.]
MDAEGFNKLNPQPEPPNPDDLIKLNPQPEPPLPVVGGLLESIFGFFGGLFGGTRQNPVMVPIPENPEPPSPMQLMTGCTEAGTKSCNNMCKYTDRDPNNCGDCGIKCQQPNVCSLGRCRATCNVGLNNCYRQCVEIQTDRNNCGKCGVKCTEGQSCSAGKCSSFASVQIEGKTEDIQKAAANITKITITSPKGGDKLYWGDELKIIWNKADIPSKYSVVYIDVIQNDDGHPALVGGGERYPNEGHANGPTTWGIFGHPPTSGEHRFNIEISTEDEIYSGSSGWFTITDNPFSPEAQNIGTSGLKQAASNIHGEIRIISPPLYHQFTQGDYIPIYWWRTNITSYDTVKIELFRKDGTFVMNVGDLSLESETGLHPNIDFYNMGTYAWMTKPYQGGTGAWPCPGCKILYDNAKKGGGEFYIQISTPDGWFIGRSLPFFIDPKELPPANIPSKE